MMTAAQAVALLVANMQSDKTTRIVDTTGLLSRETTGDEFASRVNEAVRRIDNAGLAGATVVFAIPPSTAALAHLCALMSLGCHVVLVDLREPPSVIASRLKGVTPDALLTTRKLAFASTPVVRLLLRPLVRVPPLRAFTPRLMTAQRRPGPFSPLPVVDSGAPALTMFTSGTTALPKAAHHSQKTLGAMLEAVVELLGDGTSEIIYSDQFHSLLPSLAAGAQCIVGKPDEPPRQVANLLSNRHVTTWFTTPPTLRTTLTHVQTDALRRIVVGSAPVTRSLARMVSKALPEVELLAVYAMTEAVPVAVATLSEILAYDGPGTMAGRITDGLELSFGEEEEIILRGARVARRLDSTSDAVHTGDRGHMLPTGQLVLEGRLKAMILSDARNIYPELYEPAFSELEGVREAALVGVPDDFGDEGLWLVATPEPGYDQDRLREALIASEPGRHLPLAGVMFAPLPHSGRSRKLDRSQLPNIVMGRQGTEQ